MEEYMIKLKFQIEELGYQFRNIDLLTEALTRSIRVDQINPHFHSKNRTNHRLAIVGEAVLKLVVSEYVILSSKSLEDDQCSWTTRKSKLVEWAMQTAIGMALFPNEGVNQVPNPKLLRIAASDNSSYSLSYDSFVKALFAAVFLDSGGSSGDGIENCLLLFQKLWKQFLPDDEMKRANSTCLNDIFPPPDSAIKAFWETKYLLHPTFVDSLMATLDLKSLFHFENDYLLLEALIHQSFYDDIRNDKSVVGKRKPDFQRLEFLGDAVVAVVVAEYLWDPLLECNLLLSGETISNLTKNKFLQEIFEREKLYTFVKSRGNYYGCDIVESIIGGLYVSRGFSAVRFFVLKKWGNDLLGPERIPPAKTPELSLLDLQCKLDYKFQNQQELLDAITHESFYQDCEQRQLAKPKWDRYSLIGKTMFQLTATEYAFQVSKISARSGSVEGLRNQLCGQGSLIELSDHLELFDLVRTHEALESGPTPFNRFEAFVFPLLGALNKELKAAGNTTKFKEICFRLMNPNLKQLPKRTLLECFLPSQPNAHAELRKKLDHYLEPEQYLNRIKQYVQESLGYAFKNAVLLEQALTTRACKTLSSNPSVGDCDRLSVIGKCAVGHYLVDNLYISNCNLPEKTVQEKKYQWIMSKAKNLFNLEILYWYYTVPEARKEVGTRTMDALQNCLYEAVLGAIYVDMHPTGSPIKKDWYLYLDKLVKGDYRQGESKPAPHLVIHTALMAEHQVFCSHCKAPEFRMYFPPDDVQAENEFVEKLESYDIYELRDKYSSVNALEDLEIFSGVNAMNGRTLRRVKADLAARRENDKTSTSKKPTEKAVNCSNNTAQTQAAVLSWITQMEALSKISETAPSKISQVKSESGRSQAQAVPTNEDDTGSMHDLQRSESSTQSVNSCNRSEYKYDPEGFPRRVSSSANEPSRRSSHSSIFEESFTLIEKKVQNATRAGFSSLLPSYNGTATLPEQQSVPRESQLVNRKPPAPLTGESTSFTCPKKQFDRREEKMRSAFDAYVASQSTKALPETQTNQTSESPSISDVVINIIFILIVYWILKKYNFVLFDMNFN